MPRCSQCGEEHDIFSIEPRYTRPDAFLRIPEAERKQRTRCGEDWCRLRDPDGGNEQYFLRATMPFEVLGEQRQLHWGVWVEVSEPAYRRVMDLWDDPQQASEPALPGLLANQLPDYPPTTDLPGLIHLTAPNSAPQFRLAGEVDHPLATEQRNGVYPERALEWVARFIH